MHPSHDLAAQKAGLFEHAYVFGDGRLRDGEFGGNFADCMRTVREAFDDAAARGVGERAEDAVQR